MIWNGKVIFLELEFVRVQLGLKMLHSTVTDLHVKQKHNGIHVGTLNIK